jgi:hypothetical protein
MAFNFNTTKVQGRNVVTVFLDGDLLTAGEDNPNFKQIVTQCLDGSTDGLRELFQPAIFVSATFQKITERVELRGGTIYLDEQPVDNSLTAQVKRFMDEQRDPDEWRSLVAYFERVQANPLEHSRQQLFEWVRNHDVTITPSGKLIAYKGVYSRQSTDDFGAKWQSGISGTATVNGREVTGKIPYDVGYEVTMPREAVAHDPNEACSYGLHVGTFAYARRWGNGTTLKVEVDPADVVSVPANHNGEKIRVCKFTILEVTEAEDTRAFADDIGDDPDDFYLDEPEAWDEVDETEFAQVVSAPLGKDPQTGQFTKGNPCGGAERGPLGRFVKRTTG